MKQTTTAGRLAASACALLALAVTAPYTLAADEPQLAGEDGKRDITTFITTQNRFVISDDDGTQTRVRIETDDYGKRYFVEEDGDWIETAREDLGEDMLALIDKAEEKAGTFSFGSGRIDLSEEELRQRFPNAKVMKFTEGRFDFDFPEGRSDDIKKRFEELGLDLDGEKRGVLFLNDFGFGEPSAERDLETVQRLIEQAELRMDRAEERGADARKLRKARRQLETAMETLREAQEELDME